MEICPICQNTKEESQWILCDACRIWYHIPCLNLTNVDEIKKFFCPSCTATHGQTTYKEKQSRKSSRDHTKLNYADLNEGNSAADERIWGKLLNVKNFKQDKFKRYQANQVNMELLRSTGFREPFVIETNEPELEMNMPSSDITVKDIARLVGGDDYPVEVIDVASQSEIHGWTMGRWAEYFSHPEKRDRIRNVISLEISGSELSNQITRPKIVREMDWIDLMWPVESHPEEFPRVQLYCLMGTKDSYTDFHVDFGGSSVFYHILSGYKTFYFIEPTPQNLKKYQKWTSSPDQSTTFLGDQVKECYAVQLKPGNTMLIPAGWIHAVYTPEDAIVIGGNFLQSFNIGAQIQVYAIEDATQVPLKFRFPFYQRLNWYALAKFDEWLSDPQNSTKYSQHELESMSKLANHLGDLLKNNEKIASGSKVTHSIRKQYDIPETITDPLALSDRVIRLVKNRQPPTPKLVIRLTATPKKPEKHDDSYIDEGLEEEEDDFELEDTEDEDEEYKAEYDQDIVIENKRQRVKKKKVQVQADSSSEDDSMGTSKLSAALLSKRKRLLANTSTQQKSAKQRLMDRMSRK